MKTIKSLFFFLLIISQGLASQITISDEKGCSIQETQGTNFLSLHGFDKAHKAGLSGQGQTIIFLESNVTCDHPLFEASPPITKYDVGRNIEAKGEDKSSYRYTDDHESFYDNIDSDENSTHGNHVIGMAVGQPVQKEVICGNKKHSYTLIGGAVPNAQAINIIHSHVYPSSFAWCPASRFMGTSLYGPLDALNKTGLNKNYKNLDLESMTENGGPMSQETLSWYKRDQINRWRGLKKAEVALPEIKERLALPADDSFLDAFKLASELDGVAINISAILYEIVDPLNGYHIPPQVLDFMGEALEKGDKILVVAGGNEYDNLTTLKSHVYFKDLAAHPQIGPRLLIAINAADRSKRSGIHDYQINFPNVISLPNGYAIDIDLFWSSNYPGQDLKDFAVSAFGSHVISGWKTQEDQLFSSESGTSEAAPLIASLCTLWKQKDPSLTGPQIVQKVKDTVIPIGHEEFFGKGLINAWALLQENQP